MREAQETAADCTADLHAEALSLVQNWPCKPDTEKLATFKDIQSLGVSLEGWSCSPSYNGVLWNSLYLTTRELYEAAVKGLPATQGSIAQRPGGVLEQYRKLPAGYQRLIQAFIDDVAEEL
ncbi:MAG: hypothetical protein MMC23_007345 [Stictis urceolatum]|nr:hypothetical protein [Stictis urceolata]